MAIFRRLIQTPASPEKSLKALTGTAKYKAATFARLADINDLSRDVNDQKAYTLDLVAATSGSIAVSTKKGVIKVITSGTAALLTISLLNSEFASADAEKYFILTSTSSATAISYATRAIPMTSGIGEGTLNIAISQPTSTTWGNPVYLSYQIVKIGD